MKFHFLFFLDNSSRQSVSHSKHSEISGVHGGLGVLASVLENCLAMANTSDQSNLFGW